MSKPFGGLDIAEAFVPAGWTLHLQAGNYPGDNGQMILNRPMRIEAWNGIAILGN
jgi:hypothetical protein